MTIAPTTGRGLISAGSMLIIKPQKSTCKSHSVGRKNDNMTSELLRRAITAPPKYAEAP